MRVIKRGRYSHEEIQFIRDHYLDMSDRDMGSWISRSGESVRCQRKRFRLIRTREQINKLVSDSPSNGRFKSGNLPKNTKYDGAISLRRDKSGIPYYHIRISKAEWIHLQKYLWEMVNGPVPKGSVLRSKDGNTLNVIPGNWEVISKAEHLAKNSGRDELSDKYVAMVISMKDKSMRDLIPPEILELKRSSLMLQRKIKDHERSTKGN